MFNYCLFFTFASLKVIVQCLHCIDQGPWFEWWYFTAKIMLNAPMKRNFFCFGEINEVVCFKWLSITKVNDAACSKYDSSKLADGYWRERCCFSSWYAENSRSQGHFNLRNFVPFCLEIFHSMSSFSKCSFHLTSKVKKPIALNDIYQTDDSSQISTAVTKLWTNVSLILVIYFILLVRFDLNLVSVYYRAIYIIADIRNKNFFK